MTTKRNSTTIRIKYDTKAELEKLGKFGDSHDDIIKMLLYMCLTPMWKYDGVNFTRVT